MFKTFGDLAQVVVNLFGAVPFPSQEGVPTNLGYLKPTKTLVFVDSPNKLTGYATLRKAQQLRSSFMGGWNKVIVLGWNFVTDIGKVIQNINDKNLEVLVIPPDLLDKLRTKANYEQLIKTGEIRFSSLQYVTIKPIKKTQGDSGDILEVELDNYVLLSPDALPLDEDNKKKLERVIENDPLSLIEYWSIDPEYDGATFRSMWQDYRENNEDFRIKRFAKIATPKMKEKRKVCVKVVDVLGSKALQFERLADAQTQWEPTGASTPLRLAETISKLVNKEWLDGTFVEKVSGVTADLLRFWDPKGSFADLRNVNFSRGSVAGDSECSLRSRGTESEGYPRPIHVSSS